MPGKPCPGRPVFHGPFRPGRGLKDERIDIVKGEVAMRFTILAGLFGIFGLVAPEDAFAQERKSAFLFKDVAEEVGVLPHAGALRGHGAAWGDADGTGWPDLF